MSDNKSSDQKNIKVFVRVRPISSKEENDGTCIQSLTDNSITVKEKESRDNSHFNFDMVFSHQRTQF